MNTADYFDAKCLHRFQPLNDPRWPEFLLRHPDASVFHTLPWLHALRRTYGYEPVAWSTSAPEATLQNAVVFCDIRSWLTGRRFVSLPFSDHCDLLVDSASDVAMIFSGLKEDLRRQSLRYIEMRPKHGFDAIRFGFHSTYSYCLHQLDLTPNLDTLFSNLHKDSTQRKIRRAQREALTYEEGGSSVLNKFYHLWLLTRRRHVVLPQPKRWFETLIDTFGKSLRIRIALKNNQPIAGILTLRYKDTLVYKYGCSDAQFHPLGGGHMLFWRSIEEAKSDGLRVFDLGRSEWRNTGLITFKDRWGASRSELKYLRFLDSEDQSKGAFAAAGTDWKERTAKKVLPHLSDPLVRAAGNLICKHVG